VLDKYFKNFQGVYLLKVLKNIFFYEGYSTKFATLPKKYNAQTLVDYDPL
jgi:hypothetical protein